jgi:catechol 2,3-dioxygenase-like lactoylglutathione lyase family enzyme
MRFCWDELFALSKLQSFAESLPYSVKTYAHGSRLNPRARGGDIDILVEADVSPSARWDLSLQLSLEFKKWVDEKIDVTVVPNSGKNSDEAFIFETSTKVPLIDVLDAPRLCHVAILVRNLEKAKAFCKTFGFGIEETKIFPKEGTQECYVGEEGRPARLLLVEAVAEGPYSRALKKRGPGLHHIAFLATNPDKVAAEFFGDGWNRHSISTPNSLWLFKRGMTLVEINQKEHVLVAPRQPVVDRVHLPHPLVTNSGSPLTCDLLSQKLFVHGGPLSVQIGGRQIPDSAF